MKPIVLYASKGGNTEKIAISIASELECQIMKIGQANEASDVNLDDFDLIVVGTGIYWGNPNVEVEQFLEKISLKNPKKFALFLTWGGAGKTDQSSLTRLNRILESKGQKILCEPFTCFGGRHFSLLKRGHPNGEDLKAATQWTRNLVVKMQE
jgi:flavodoxin